MGSNPAQGSSESLAALGVCICLALYPSCTDAGWYCHTDDPKCAGRGKLKKRDYSELHRPWLYYCIGVV